MNTIRPDQPLLDEVMRSPDDCERETVLMRYFENRSFAGIGADYGLKENSAPVRTDHVVQSSKEDRG